MLNVIDLSHGDYFSINDIDETWEKYHLKIVVKHADK